MNLGRIKLRQGKILAFTTLIISVSLLFIAPSHSLAEGVSNESSFSPVEDLSNETNFSATEDVSNESYMSSPENISNESSFFSAEDSSGEPAFKPTQSNEEYYNELLQYYLNNGYVVRNDNGARYNSTYPKNMRTQIEFKKIKRFPKERPGVSDFRVFFGTDLNNNVPRPLYSYEDTQFVEDFGRTRDSATLQGQITDSSSFKPANNSQRLSFTLRPYITKDKNGEGEEGFNQYTTNVWMGSRNTTASYEGHFQGMTFLEYDDGKEANAKPIQFNWGKDDSMSNLLWNESEERLIFLARSYSDNKKILKMSIYPNLKQQNFTNEFTLYNTSTVAKNYRLLYSQLIEFKPGSHLVNSRVPYYSLGIDSNGNPKGFYATNDGPDKTIMSWRVDNENAPENFVISEDDIYVGTINDLDIWEKQKNAYNAGYRLQPLDKQLVGYKPANGTGKGAEADAKNKVFGTLINPRNPAKFGQFHDYASAINFKSYPEKLAQGEKITMSFGTGIDTLFDKPAITELADMDIREGENLDLTMNWYDQNPGSTGLKIEPYLDGVPLDVISIVKNTLEETQGEFQFSIPKDKFKVGKPNKVSFKIKDSMFNEGLPENDKNNLKSFNESSFKVNYLRKIPINYKDTAGNGYEVDPKFITSHFGLDGESFTFDVPATVGDKKNPLEGVLPADDLDVVLNKSKKTVKFTVDEKYKSGITVVYKVMEVEGTVKFVNEKGKTIYQDIKGGVELEDYKIPKIEVGSSVQTAIDNAKKLAEKPLVLTHSGYTLLPEYRVLVNGSPVTDSKVVPGSNFVIEFKYRGETSLVTVPEIKFSAGNISNDSTVKQSLEGDNATLEMHDTLNTTDTKITLSLASQIINEDKQVYGGEIRYKTGVAGEDDVSLTTKSSIVVMNSTKDKHFNSISLKNSDTAQPNLYMVQYPGNYDGSYKASLLWKLEPNTTKEAAK